ncbi:MAG TPA: glycosyltransferase family 2 protein, partial [Gaiellaceae bacterium]|nr:glycosyltransferase family 2 protein [Gaiellaceae bacterium]
DAVNPPTCVVTRQRALEQLPPVSVIIPTIGSNPRLANCVSSVLASDHPRERLEIVVVENRPRDSTTKAQLAQLADDRVTYHSTARVGAAHARNVGTAAATGDIVVFFDSDVVVDSQCVSALAQELIVDADVATGNVLPLALDTQAQLLLERFGGYGKGFDLRRFRFAETQGVDRFRAGRLGTGANMAFRRDVLMELGPMCEFLGPGTPSKSGDDSELLLRALIQGFRVTYTPAALVWHPSHADENALKSQLFGYGAGLSAHLVHLVLEYPKLLVDFVSILPAILRFFGSGTSTKNSSRGADFPIALRMAELRGVAWGLPAYAKSRASRGLSDGSE